MTGKIALPFKFNHQRQKWNHQAGEQPNRDKRQAMCSSSIFGRVNQLKAHVTKFYSVNSTTGSNLTRTSADDLDGWCATLTLMIRLVSYLAIFTVIVLVIYLIMKYLANFGEDGTGEGNSTTETNPLRSGKTVSFSYGTCDDRDLESGNCETSSSSSSSSSSEEELYDGKLCVICYDEERNCFFVPCGHCATCYDCAKRISSEENKVCPVCRRLIRKIRKLFAP